MKLSLAVLEARFNGVVHDRAQAKVLARQVTGLVDGTDWETTARYEGCGQATRKRQITDKRGKVREIEVTLYGWKRLVMIEVRTNIPPAAKVVQLQDHEASLTREWVTPAQVNLAPHARLCRVVFDRGFWDGADLGGLAAAETGGRPPRAHGGPRAGEAPRAETARHRRRGRYGVDDLRPVGP